LKHEISNLNLKKRDVKEQISYLKNTLQEKIKFGRTEFDTSVEEQYFKISEYITDLLFFVNKNLRESKQSSSYPNIDNVMFNIQKLTYHWENPANFNVNINFIDSLEVVLVNEFSEFDKYLYISIVNTLLAYSKMDNENLNLESTNLIFYLLEYLEGSNYINVEECKDVINDLKILIEYRSNKISKYQFPKNIILLGFICFIFKLNSLGELTQLIYSNNINDSYIAYSFYAAYHGFANLPKTFTNIILDGNNERLAQYIDNYLFSNYLNKN